MGVNRWGSYSSIHTGPWNRPFSPSRMYHSSHDIPIVEYHHRILCRVLKYDYHHHRCPECALKVLLRMWSPLMLGLFLASGVSYAMHVFFAQFKGKTAKYNGSKQCGTSSHFRTIQYIYMPHSVGRYTTCLQRQNKRRKQHFRLRNGMWFTMIYMHVNVSWWGGGGLSVSWRRLGEGGNFYSRQYAYI